MGLRPGGFWRARFTTDDKTLVALDYDRRGDAPDQMTQLGDEVQRQGISDALIRKAPPGQSRSVQRRACRRMISARRDNRQDAFFRPCMASCAGYLNIPSMDLRGIPRRRRQKQTGRELLARHGNIQTGKTVRGRASRILKKLSRALPGRIGREKGAAGLQFLWFARRGHRPKEQDHPPLQARHWSRRRTNRLGKSARSAPSTSCPDATREAMNLHLAEIAAQIAPGAHRSSILVDQSRLASVGPGSPAAQHHLDPVAGEMSGAQSAGKRLAVQARQLAFQTEIFGNPLTSRSSTIAARPEQPPLRVHRLRNWARSINGTV